MISVIVIGRNEAEALPSCFDSIERCMHTLQHEILYIDSRSTDGSPEIAKAHGARCFLLKDEDTNAGLGRFVGAKEAKGEFLLFLDGDMELLPGFVQKAMMEMASKECRAVVGQRSDIYMKNGKEIGRKANYFGCTVPRNCPEFGGALFIKKEELEKCGSWSTDTVACEESELHARLEAAKVPVLEIPIPMIVHTDRVRDSRGILSILFSRRRLGEGQAFRCAAEKKAAGAYIRRNREKFLLYAADLCCLLVLLIGIVVGIASHKALPFGVCLGICLFVQAVQLGRALSCGKLRSFVSQKLFFFAFPAGLLTWHRHSAGYTELS